MVVKKDKLCYICIESREYMKKNKKNLLFIFLLLIVPISQVYADSIMISCPSEIESNSQFVCQIIGSTTSGVNQFKRNFLYAGDTIRSNFSIGSLILKNNVGSDNTILIDKVFFCRFK